MFLASRNALSLYTIVPAITFTASRAVFWPRQEIHAAHEILKGPVGAQGGTEHRKPDRHCMEMRSGVWYGATAKS